MTVTTASRVDVDDLGSGGPALLMVPGWCGDRTVFDPLLAPLSQHRRTLSTDLRQHGQAARSGGDFGTAEVVDDLVALVTERGLDRVVPVALSHAGWAAIELRRRLGADVVPALVLLDWMPLGTPPGFLDALDGLEHPQAWEAVRSGLFAMWTGEIEVPELHRYVYSMGEYGFEYWRRAGREIKAAFEAAGTPLAALESGGTPCPTLHLYAQPTDDGYLAAQQAYAAEHPWFQVRRLDAESHFPMFEVPEQVASAVEEFVCRLG